MDTDKSYWFGRNIFIEQIKDKEFECKKETLKTMGEFNKNPKIKDHFEVASESVMKTVFSFIPAGPIFDSFWNYRATLKQKRVIDFSDSVKKALEEIGGYELHSSNFETKDFVDIMEATYLRVMNTRSEYKLERFRNILVNQIIEPTLETPMFMKYIQLLDQLDDAQIVLLDNFRYWEGQKINSIAVAYFGIEHKNYSGDHVMETLSQNLSRVITLAEAEYYMNELVSLGLIVNVSVSMPVVGKNSPHNNFQISIIGKSFLKFIEISGAN